jgi:hypothetical protein
VFSSSERATGTENGPDDLDGCRAQHVIFIVCKCLRWRNDDRISSVRAERVKVLVDPICQRHVFALRVRRPCVPHLHVADGDAVVVGITDNLVFKLPPPLEALLDKHLRAQAERLGRKIAELFLIVRKAGSETTERVGRAQDDGVADLLGRVERVSDSRDGCRLRCRDIDLYSASLSQCRANMRSRSMVGTDHSRPSRRGHGPQRPEVFEWAVATTSV